MHNNMMKTCLACMKPVPLQATRCPSCTSHIDSWTGRPLTQWEIEGKPNPNHDQLTTVSSSLLLFIMAIAAMTYWQTFWPLGIWLIFMMIKLWQMA